MQTLVIGSTGATGHLLVRQLLTQGVRVKAIARQAKSLRDKVVRNDGLEIIEASILDIPLVQLQHHLRDCQAVACCLGHPLSLRGIFGQPRRLVSDAVLRLCEAIEANAPSTAVRVVLMGSSGVRNAALAERVSLPERAALGLLRWCVPPHADNETAAAVLQERIGSRHAMIEWSVIRPDALKNTPSISPYTLHPSPIRSALFNPGKASRINVAHAMASLMTQHDLWQQWRSQMPVLYNQTPD